MKGAPRMLARLAFMAVLAPACIADTVLAEQIGGADGPRKVLTGKERLGGKASDEQRVDNCKVPPKLRGPKPRPDTCNHGKPPPATQ